MARRGASAQLALPLESPRSGIVKPRAQATTGAVYEAAAMTRRTLGWRAPTTGPNQSALDNLLTLRDRSRVAVRNDGYAKGIIDRLVSNVVGTGITPLSRAADRAFRKSVQALWLRWTDFSDADGVLDFYGQQAQAVRGWFDAGEVFLRLRPRLAGDGLPVPFQVQVIEPELCPHDYNSVAPGPNGNRIRAGIEFDQIGRRVAYYFYGQVPGDLLDWNVGDLRRVPAESVVHLYDPLRPGQIRGLPHLTQALIRLRELDKYVDATVLRQQIGNLFAAFIKRPAGDPTASVNPLTGQAATDTDAEGRPVVGLEPGISQELGPGEEIEFSDPPDPPLTFPAFMKQQLMAIAAATGVPYQVLTGDMEGTNDRVVRVLLNEFQRFCQRFQEHVAFQMCAPVWKAWLDRVVLFGALPIPPAAYAADPSAWADVEWKPQAWKYVHPVQDVEAQRAAIRAGFTSRAAIVREQGYDAEVVDEEQALDNQRADGLGLIYESDGRQPVGGGAAAPADAQAMGA